MNSPFPMPAGSAAQPVAAKTRVITITKPAAGQAYTVDLSHDGSVKLDLSQIANEKIMIVKVPSGIPGAGEKAIIIFDNQAAITIDPFFFSGSWPVNLTVDWGSQHDLTVDQFASIFPVTTDTSVIPAGGEQADQSGQTFEPPAVDPLGPANPLALLPPEELPNWQPTTLLATFQDGDLIPTPSGIDIRITVEEENLPGPGPQTASGKGNEDANGIDDTDQSGPPFVDNVTLDFSGSLASLVSGGNLPLTFGFKSTLEGTAVHDSTGADVTSLHETVTYHVVSATEIDGVAGERVIFTFTLNTDGTFSFHLNDQIDHPAGQGENQLFLNLTEILNIEDADHEVVDFTTNPDAFLVEVLDDTPTLKPGFDFKVVDEDDIKTFESHGTSPNDGNFFDGSFTGDPGDNNPGPATVFGNLMDRVSGGADAFPGYDGTPSGGLPVEFSLVSTAATALSSLHLESQGRELSYQLVGNTLIGFVNSVGIGQSYDPQFGDRLVFKFTVDVNGDYKFELYDQLDHDAGKGQNTDLADHNSPFIDFGQLVQATDYDGDSVVLDNKLFIEVRDDVPVLSGDKEFRFINEDDIRTSLSTGTSPNDGDGDGSFTGLPGSNQPGPADIFGSLADLVRIGADENPNSFFNHTGIVFSFDSSKLWTLNVLGLTSQGDKITFTIGNSGHDLIGTASDGRVVMDLNLQQNGNYTLKLFDQVDHDAPYDNPGDHPTLPGDTATADQNTDLHDGIFGDVNEINFGGVIKATDYDGDSVSLSGVFKVAIVDDIPTIEVSPNADVFPGADAVSLDETIGADRYSASDVAHDNNGPSDDTGLASPFGEVTTSVTNGLGSLFTITSNVGADEPGTSTAALSLVLSGGDQNGVATNLTATATGAAAGLSAADRAIVLIDVGGVVEGVLASDHSKIAFTIGLTSSDPSAQLKVDQFMAIDHGADGNQFDSQLPLQLTNGSLALELDASLTDYDQDSASGSAQITLANSDGSFIAFDDDGPKPAEVTETNLVNNGLFFDGFTPNGDIWGPGSGTDSTGTAGGWTIQASDYEGASFVELQKVADGYLGADSPTNSPIVDLEATPGNLQITQQINGLTDGTKYLLTFEVGEANFGSAKLNVIWDGNIIDTIDPTSGLMQTIALQVQATGTTGTLEFQEIGESGDNTGTFLANVRLSNLVIIDETPGVDADSNDTLDPAVAAAFASVGNPGSDPAMGSPQFAKGTTSVVDIGTPDFGTDGPAAVNPIQYGLAVTSADSGLSTTEGQAIQLFLENGIVVGRYDSDNSGTVDAADNAAFAISIDGSGVLSVAQYVSLEHPDHTSSDEGIQLDPGTISATVTLTDGDGDHTTSSTDISNAVLFEDDGPVSISADIAVGEVYEDGLSAAAGNLSDGNSEPGHGPISVDVTTTELQNFVTVGADDPAIFSLNSDISGAVKTSGGVAVTSKNDAVKFAFDSGSGNIIGYADVDSSGSFNGTDRVVFTLHDNGNGTFTFTLNDQVDHPWHDGDGTSGLGDLQTLDLNLISAFLATDSDGDSVPLTQGDLAVTIEDDIPFFSTGEYDLTVTSLNAPFSGTVDLHIGADEPPHFDVTPESITGVTTQTTVDPVTGGITITGSYDGNPLYIFNFDPSNQSYSFILEAMPQVTTPLAAVDLSEAYAPVQSKDFGPFTFVADAGHSINGSAQGTGVDDDNLMGGEHLTILFDNPMTAANIGVNFVGNPNGIDIQWLATNTTTSQTETGTAHVNADGTIDIVANGVDLTQFDKLELTGLGNDNNVKVKITSLGGTEIGDGTIGPFTFDVTGTDFDGDPAQTKIVINADVTSPLVESGVFSGTVEEEQLGNSIQPAFGSSFTGNEDTDSALGNDHDTASSGAGSLITTNVALGNFAVTGGTGPYTFHFAPSGIEGTQAVFSTGPATSQGAPIYLHVNGNTLTGYVDGAGGTADQYDAGTDRVVFTFQITDTATGDATFTLYDNVDHTGTGEDTLALSLNGVVEVTDSASTPNTLALNGSVDIIDDTPTVGAGLATERALSLVSLDLDETIGADRYGAGDATQDNNGASDDSPINVPGAIGELTTTVANGLGSLFSVTPSYGADGPHAGTSLTESLSLVLTTSSQTGAATNMAATAVGAAAGLDAAHRAIVLVQVDATTVEGHVVGTDGVGGTGDDLVAFRISLTSTDPATAQLRVDQFMAIQDPVTGATFDEQLALNLTGTDKLSLQLDATATDGDGDTASTSTSLSLVTNAASFLAFDDDGPIANNDTDAVTTGLHTLTFDDIPLADGQERPLSTYGDATHGYGGFIITQGGVYNPVGTGTYFPTSGSNLGFIGEKAGSDIPGYTGNPGDPITITKANGENFNPKGIELSSNSDDPLTIVITGYLGAVTHTITVTNVHKGSATAVDLSSLGTVDHITIDSPSGANNLYFGFDDFTYTDTHASTTGNVITGLGTTSGVAGADSPGADGGHVSAVAFGNFSDSSADANGNFTVNGTHGSLIINADGTYTYTQTDTAGGSDVFVYTLTDGDGDSTTATLTITSPGLTTPLLAGNGFTGTVEEEQLVHVSNPNDASFDPSFTGNEDETASPDNDNDTLADHNITNAVATGTLTVTGGTGPYNFTFDTSLEGTQATFGGAPATSGGQAVLYHFVDGNTLIGYVNSGAAGFQDGTDHVVFELQINTDANSTDASSGYTFTLYNELDHKGAQLGDNVEGTLSLDFSNTVIASDSSGINPSIKLGGSVNVIDDIPTAQGESAQAAPGVKPTMNAILVLDFSASMNDIVPNTGGKTRLEIMKEAVHDFLTSNDVTFNQVTVYTFGINATLVGQYNTASAADSAIAALNNTTAGTNYAAATSLVDGASADGYAQLSHPAADMTNLYFLTDGDPTGGTSLTGPQQTAWTNFLNDSTNDPDYSAIDHVYAMGFSDINNTNFLSQIAPRAGSDTAEIVTNPIELPNTLTETIAAPALGNVLTNDSFGADGGHILSIKVGNTVYTQPQGDTHITVTTPLGGSLTFYFVDDGIHKAGDYSYTADTVTPDIGQSEIFHYVLTDGDGDTVGADLTINIVAPDQAPVNSVPGSQAVTQGVAYTFDTAHNNKISVSDVDANGGSEKVTLTATHGTITLSTTAGLAFSAGDGTSDATMTFTGTIAQINAALNGLKYTSDANFSGAASITITTNDQGNTGPGGPLSDTDTINLTVAAPDQAPTANITNTTFSATEQTDLYLAGEAGAGGGNGASLGSIADVDAGSGNMTITLSVASGILTVTAGNSGISAANISGSGTNSVTVTGTLAQINNLLGGVDTGNGDEGNIIYNANSDSPPASSTLTLLVNDNGNTGAGGPLTGSDTATINISAVNDAPTATITPPTYSATEQLSLTLKGTGLSIGDVDAGGGSMTVTLSVGEGTLNATGGNSGASVSGSGTNSLTITGTIAQINAFFGAASTSTLSYIDNTDTPSANTTLTLLVNDNGNTGSGGAKTGSDTAQINITAVNDAPVANNDHVITNLGTNTSILIPTAWLLANDTDAENNTLSVTNLAQSSPSTGTISGPSGGNVTFNDGNTLDGSFTYKATDNGSPNATSAASATVSVDDNLTTVHTLTGTAGVDIFIAGSGDDTMISGGGNDFVNGGGGTNTFQIGSDYTDSNDAQIVNVQNITMTAAATLDISHQTEGFNVTGSGGDDTIKTGSGNDVITAGAGSDNIDVSTGGTDTIVINAVVGTSSDSARDHIAGNGNDTGQDTITDFNFSSDTIQIVATNVHDFTHGADTSIGSAGGSDSGGASSFTTATGLIDLNGDGDFADSGDIAVTFSSALNMASFEGRLQYDLTGTSQADTITGGSLADTIDGGGGNDTINGGAGGDTLIGGAGADTIDVGVGDDNAQDVVVYAATSEFGDTITNFDVTGNSSQIDLVEFTGALATLLDANNNGTLQWTSGNGSNNGNTALVAGTEGLFLAGTNGEGVSTANLDSASAVAAEFNAEFDTSGVPNGKSMLLVVNDTDNGSNQASVWLWTQTAGGGNNSDIQASELVEVTHVTANAALASGNLDLHS